MLYTLKAEALTPSGYNHAEELHIEADNDLDATFEAIFFTLDMAYDRPGSPWHVGEVTLTNAAGDVLHTMPAKTSDHQSP